MSTDTPPTFAEFMNVVLSVFPHAQVEEDNDGQLVVYTGLRETESVGGTVVVPFEAAE